MLSLPSTIFRQTMLFTEPKDVASSTRVSKRVLQECKSPLLWKQLQKHHFPDLPIDGDYENAVRDIVKPNTTRLTSDKVEFVLNFHKKRELMYSHRWRKGTNSFVPETKCDALKQEIHNWECDRELLVPEITCELFVIFHGARKQYRKIELEFEDLGDRELFFTGWEGVSVDLEILSNRDVTLELWNEFKDWENETLHVTHPKFASEFASILKFADM